MYVKPKDGMKIWDPEVRGYLPPEGRKMPEAHLLHFTRAVNDGDAVFLTDEEGAKSVAAADAERAKAALAADKAKAAESADASKKTQGEK